MKKSLILCAALLACAFGFQSCDKVDNPTGEPLEPTKTVIDNGSDLKDVIAKFAKDGVLTLPADVELTMNEKIELTEPLTIVGDEEKPATIIAKAGFVISNNFALENVKIDATDLESQLIIFSKDGSKIKNQDVYTDAGATDYSLLGELSVKNCMIKNLKNSFIATNGNWAVVALKIQNNIIQLNDESKNFIAFDNSGNCWAKETVIDGNTIYNIADATKSNAYFIRCGNASNAAKIFGTNNGTSVTEFTLTNNTLINTFAKKQFGNNTPNNKVTTLNVKKNVFVDVFRLNKFIQGNNTKNIENNFIAVEKTEKVDGADNIATTVETMGFTSPTVALDLTAVKGGLNLTPTGDAANAGDPRWTANAQ